MQSGQSGPQPRPRPLAAEAACPCFPALILGAPTVSSIGEKETLRVSKGPGVQPSPPAARGAEACDGGGREGHARGRRVLWFHTPRGPGPAHSPTRCLLKPGLGPLGRREGPGWSDSARVLCHRATRSAPRATRRAPSPVLSESGERMGAPRQTQIYGVVLVSGL